MWRCTRGSRRRAYSLNHQRASLSGRFHDVQLKGSRRLRQCAESQQVAATLRRVSKTRKATLTPEVAVWQMNYPGFEGHAHVRRRQKGSSEDEHADGDAIEE